MVGRSGVGWGGGRGGEKGVPGHQKAHRDFGVLLLRATLTGQDMVFGSRKVEWGRIN